MSIRLGKAISELNIGLQTAVEFLEKKSELGEVKAEPTFKLNDAQHQALVKAFHKDKEVRNQADKLFPKKTKEKKRAAEDKDHRAETVLNAGKQQYKPLGKIDLSDLNGKGSAKKSDVKAVQDDKEETKPAAGGEVSNKAESVSAEKQEKVEKVETPKQKVETVEQKPEMKAETPQTTPVEKAEAKTEQKEQPAKDAKTHAAQPAAAAKEMGEKKQEHAVKAPNKTITHKQFMHFIIKTILKFIVKTGTKPKNVTVSGFPFLSNIGWLFSSFLIFVIGLKIRKAFSPFFT